MIHMIIVVNSVVVRHVPVHDGRWALRPSLVLEVELLRREKAQMENEAKYRRFQRDPIGTHFGEMTPARRRERERELREKSEMRTRASAVRPPPLSAAAAA